MGYSEKLIDHYENPRNVGTLDTKDDTVGTGMVGAPACGDVMRLQIKVTPEGVIEDAKFKTYGCGSAIAPPVKIHCSILAEDAIKAAINDYRKKQAKE